MSNAKISQDKIGIVENIAAVLIFAGSVLSFVYEANGFDFRLLRHAFSEYGGALQALPGDVVHAYLLSKNQKLNRFSVEGVLLSHPLLHQRAVEFLYPARFEPGGGAVLALEGEGVSRDCPVVAKSGRVVLYECSNE
jgi:hypothetical protein